MSICNFAETSTISVFPGLWAATHPSIGLYCLQLYTVQALNVSTFHLCTIFSKRTLFLLNIRFSRFTKTSGRKIMFGRKITAFSNNLRVFLLRELLILFAKVQIHRFILKLCTKSRAAHAGHWQNDQLLGSFVNSLYTRLPSSSHPKVSKQAALNDLFVKYFSLTLKQLFIHRTVWGSWAYKSNSYPPPADVWKGRSKSR